MRCDLTPYIVAAFVMMNEETHQLFVMMTDFTSPSGHYLKNTHKL